MGRWLLLAVPVSGLLWAGLFALTAWVPLWIVLALLIGAAFLAARAMENAPTMEEE